MLIDYLVIGQGISGTWLSYYLRKEGKSVLVIDNNNKNAASRLAAGIINPVTGRRHVQVWMSEEILPYAFEAYRAIGEELGIEAITQKNIIDFFPTPQMRLSFMQRVEEKAEYVYDHPGLDRFSPLFNFDFGCGEINPVYTVHLDILLPAWRKKLTEKGQLREESFDNDQLSASNEKIIYKDITASKIIFCDGMNSTTNPFFQLLPFAPNKGELLIVSIPELPPGNIYKKGMMLAPLSAAGLWWLGSSYAWDFENADPSPSFGENAKSLLRHWLKVPFKVLHHEAGIRPATLERRPFVGIHPFHPQVGILNGMGTKGCSLAPFFAKQLSDNLCHEKTIQPDADILRFRNILARKSS